jgi:hypothetical protein
VAAAAAAAAAADDDAPSADRPLVSSAPLVRHQNRATLNVIPCVREFPWRMPQAGGVACPACTAVAASQRWVRAIGRCGRCIAAFKEAQR